MHRVDAAHARTFLRPPDLVAERYTQRGEQTGECNALLSRLDGRWVRLAALRRVDHDRAARWLDGQAQLKASTQERYAGILRAHVVPRWGAVKLGDVTHSAVQSWVSELTRSVAPATVRKVHRVLSRVLSSAVKNGRLVRNPAEGVNLPRVVEGERRYLTHGQVDALATACGPYRLLVLVLTYTGVRWGEMAALRMGPDRPAAAPCRHRRVGHARQGRADLGHLEGARAPVRADFPGFLDDDLAAHLAGKKSDALVFTGEKGGALRAQVFQRAAFNDAAETVGAAPMHPHELRHTAASLATASSADVKVVQQILGHKSATMTADLYGHLFPDRLDVVAEAMDAARAAALVAPALPEAQICRSWRRPRNDQTPRSGGLSV